MLDIIEKVKSYFEITANPYFFFMRRFKQTSTIVTCLLLYFTLRFTWVD